MSNEEKLAILNKLEVVDTDFDSDNTVIYIDVLNNEENMKVLRKLGATDEDLKIMCGDKLDNEEIDISYFAFTKLDADFYNRVTGFKLASEEDKLCWQCVHLSDDGCHCDLTGENVVIDMTPRDTYICDSYSKNNEIKK